MWPLVFFVASKIFSSHKEFQRLRCRGRKVVRRGSDAPFSPLASVRIAEWPVDLSAPRAYHLIGIALEKQGQELCRVAPRMVSVHNDLGY
jgi:hypothetical protein